MATGGLYGQSSAGIVSPQSGSESSGLYGNNTVFGGTYFEWFIFQVSDVQPDTPTGGSWDFSTNVGTAPDGWLASPPVNPTNTVWVSVGVVSSKNNTAIVWSEPGKFSFASGLPILSGASAPVSGDGQSDQLYIETGTTPETIWFKQAGTWTRLTGSSLYMDLTSNQTIAGTKTFSSEIQGSVSGTSSNVSGIVDITHGGTGSTTASAARAALGAAASGANSDITSLSGITGGISTADYLQLDTAITPSVGVAKLQWDTTWGGPQIGMEGGNVNLQIGQETLIRVYNNTGSSLTDGQVVYVTGSQGQRLTVALAQANADSTSAAIIGMVTETIANNSSGFVTTQGMVNGINTNGFTDGAVVYLSPTTPGAWTTTKPVAPQHMVMVGYIVKGGSVGAGSIYINTQNGYELDELHNVLITSPVTGQTITYDSGTGVWSNNTVSLTSGVNGTLPITSGGTGQTTANAAFNALAPSQAGNSGKYLTTDGSNTSWATNPLGTVTSVGGTGTVSGITLSGTVTTSGNLTLGGSLDLSSPPAIGSTTPSTGAFTTLTTTSTINGITVGKGAGAVSTNTAVGVSALAANTSGSGNASFGDRALTSNTTGGNQTAVGQLALYSSTTGSSNTGLGHAALFATTTGNYNTAIGDLALNANTTASNNTAVGYQAANANTTGTNITAVGFSALKAQTAGDATAVGYNAAVNTTTGVVTAIGVQTLTANTTGTFNSGSGYRALYSNTTGSYNAAFGDQALYLNTTASNNTAVGYQAGYSITSAGIVTAVGYQAAFQAGGAGSHVTAFGYQAGYGYKGPAENSSSTFIGYRSGGYNGLGVTGRDNVGLGGMTLYSLTAGAVNTALGSYAMFSTTTGDNNTAVGYVSLYSNTTGGNNVAVGREALQANTTANRNSAVGFQSLYTNTTGAENSALGHSSLYYNTTGNYNVAVGGGALQANTTASNNTAVGYQAGYGNTTGINCVAVGYQALYGANTGESNIAIGYGALRANTSGLRNTAVGGDASGSAYGPLAANTTGNLNTALGAISLVANTTGSYNVGIGSSALRSNTTASRNTAVGYQAGYAFTNGYANTCVGYTSGFACTGTANTFIGDNSGVAATSGSFNTFVGQAAGSAVTTGGRNVILGGYNGNVGGLDIRTASNYIVLSDGDGNPRGVFDGSGNFVVGATSSTYRGKFTGTSSFGGVRVDAPGSGSYWPMYLNDTDATSTSQILVDIRRADTRVGYISTTNTTTTYATSSDYRLKENVQPMTDALSIVQALKPCTYKWKVDGSDGQGFLAHELQEIVPDAVVGEKDAVNEDGSIKAQGIDTSFLVATLTAAIQELKAEFDAYKATHP